MIHLNTSRVERDETRIAEERGLIHLRIVSARNFDSNINNSECKIIEQITVIKQNESIKLRYYCIEYFRADSFYICDWSSVLVKLLVFRENRPWM